MKINELKLVYFSPTGATRRTVMEAARSIGLKSVSHDLSVYKEKKPVLRFGADDFVLFGIPVYYGRVPALFMDYLENISGNGTPAALIATYGCRQYDDALLELKTETEKRGFRVIGAGAFPAEHSIVPAIGARRPNKNDLKQASEFGVELARRLRKENDFTGFDLSVPGNTPYHPYGKNALVPKAEVNLCTECGACAKGCPAGAISVSDPKKTDSKKCIGCMRCVQICRQKARSVNSLKMKLAERKLKKVCQSDLAPEFFL